MVEKWLFLEKWSELASLGKKIFVEALQTIINDDDIPCRFYIEVPLPLLGSILWPQASSNDLKNRNKILARILRRKGVRIERRHGRRYALIPERLLAPKKRKTKLEVEEVWKW